MTAPAIALEQMPEFAHSFLAGLEPHADRSFVVTLSGDLGAGKTTFVQAVAKALGVEDHVTSPTFVIEKIYPLTDQKFSRLVHIDAYRLERPHELEVLGFTELLRDPGNLVLIEWPERVPQLIPNDAVKMAFDIRGDERTISINGKKEG